MNNIFSIAIISCLLFTGCGNTWLEEAQPSTSSESSEAIKSARDAQYALNGVYDILRGHEYYGARMTYYADVTGEDMLANGDTKRAAKYYLFDWNEDTAPSSFWYQPYRVIRNVNNILDYVNNIEESAMTDEIRDIKGQALALRGMAHFDLVKVYGKPYTMDDGASLGVPIQLVKSDPTNKPARNTVKEVYTQVIADLDDAVKLLSSARNDGKVNKFAAQQLLARAYLYTGQNQLAYKNATEMIVEAAASKGKYKLWSNAEYNTVWAKDFTSEILFQLSLTKTEPGSGKDNVGYLMWTNGYDDIVLSNDYISLLGADPDDVRNKIVTKQTKKNIDYYYLNKYPGNTSAGENPENADIPVLRLSEAYLIAAEAAVKLADNVNALKYLNAIVTRANPDKVLTGTVTLDRVLEERRRELVGEGHRLFDAMRNNKRIERKGANHSSPSLRPETKSFDRSFPKILMPIPRGEIDTNPNVKPNA